MNISLYIHFPFCLKKCLYCDFDSVAGSPTAPDEYAGAVLREMELRAAILPGPISAPTLYFGGGTPSLMTPELVGRVVDAAARQYGLEHDAEVTLEVNPGTVTLDKLTGYRSAGVNRLSIGVQSLDDALLQRLGRIHSAEDAFTAFDVARKARFRNISIDLIHSLPAQTPTMWRSTLDAATGLAPEHISAYALSVEEETPFAAMAERGQLPLPADEDAAAMFEITREILGRKGYEHYEVSNFALPERRSRHNQIYWRRGNYLGFGAGAHSFMEDPEWGVRWANVRNLQCYLPAIREGRLVEGDRQTVSLRDAVGEAFFLGLRLLDGVDLSVLKARFGGAVEDFFGSTISELLDRGLLVRNGETVRLSSQVIIFANQVFSRFV